MNYIDYTQYSAYSKCPWFWYERYVRNVATVWPDHQRTDPLCLGSLVHSGLENYIKHSTLEIPKEVVEEQTPSPETLQLAYLLVQGYINAYPQEDWSLHITEDTLTFPLSNYSDTLGVAKLDAYFYNPSLKIIETGVEGYTVALQPGWWAREYKTKSPYIARPAWIQEWQTKLQASFQCLALQQLIGAPVEGVLVSVLEKPKVYIPKRKCVGCGEQFELGAYLPTGEGGHACPMCGHLQQLKPYVPKVPPKPEYFRVVVSRTQEQLDLAKEIITSTAFAMEQLRTGGVNPELIGNREQCVVARNGKWGICDFFDGHTYRRDVLDDQRFKVGDTTRYMGLTVEVTE